MDDSYDPHFTRAVADLGDRREILTSAPIYSSSGIKLVDQGVRIDSRLYERLVAHKLKAPIDQSLTMADAIDGEALWTEVQSLILERAFCARLAEAVGSSALLAVVCKLPLPAAAALKLTVMREQRHELFVHSLQVTLVAIYLGSRLGYAEDRLVSLAAAALMHDFGVLHIDPALLQADRKMDAVERRHLFAHPLTSMLFVQQMPGFGPEVAAAVLEHHERLDGSGYPRGLRGDEISEFGKILLLAEVVSAMFERNWDAPGLRLSLLLRLNHRKFEQAHINHVAALLKRETETLSRVGDEAALLARLAGLHAVPAHWDALKARLAPSQLEASEAARYLDTCLVDLRRSLLEAGFDLSQEGTALDAALDDDPQAAAELILLGREALWQLENVAVEVLRRIGTAPSGAADTAAAEWCAWQAEWLK